MAGTTIATLRYIQGHSDLGDQSLAVSLIGHATNLTVRQVVGGQALFSIPWANFRDAAWGTVWKRGLASAGAFVASAIPLINLTNAGSSFWDGFWLRYWDEEIQRYQEAYFETGSENRARRIIQEIYKYRDNYYRQTGRASSPERRTLSTASRKPAAVKKRKPTAKSARKTATGRKSTKKK